MAARNLKLGEWKLVERLDKGVVHAAPTSVWRALDPRGREVAMKVIRGASRTSTRYARFRDEVEALVMYGDHPGILPILDFHLPEDPKADHPWLAMPIALPIRMAIGDKPTLRHAVEVLLPITRTLADLAEKGVFHRDLKPDNLFLYNDKPVVGDFGLVYFPGKQRRTVGNRRLGPAHFHADEMLTNPDTADPGPADVFSILKCLYVLATGADWPPQGQQRLEHAPFLLSVIFEDERPATLDLLIERGTSPVVADRPSMRQIEHELAAWLKPERKVSETGDVKELFRRIKDQLERDRRSRTDLQELDAALNGVVEHFRPTLARIKEIYLDSFYAANDESHSYLIQQAAHALGLPTEWDPRKLPPRSAAVTGASTYGEVVVHSGVIAWLESDSTVRVLAAHVVSGESPSAAPEVLWMESRSFLLGGAQAELELPVLQQGLLDNLAIVATIAEKAFAQRRRPARS